MLRQRPWITRGMLTALILLAIIALWAAVFLFGLREVFARTRRPRPRRRRSSSPPTSPRPAYTGAGPAEPAPTGMHCPRTAACRPGSAGPSPARSPRPAAANRSAGSWWTRCGPTADGSLVLAASSATQADGSYQVAGLFPASYVLQVQRRRVRSGLLPGGRRPGRRDPGDRRIRLRSPPGINVVITGQPASITGAVDLGDTLQPVVTTVTARATQGANAGQDVATTTTDGDNAYTTARPAGARGLRAELRGRRVTSRSVVQTTVDGGSQRIQPTRAAHRRPRADLRASVTDGTAPLGGATVTTTVGGTTVTTGTPTTGDVGRFVLGDLPTPATYVLTDQRPRVTAAPPSWSTSDRRPAARPTWPFRLSSGTGTAHRRAGRRGRGRHRRGHGDGRRHDQPADHQHPDRGHGRARSPSPGCPPAPSLTLTFDQGRVTRRRPCRSSSAATAPLTVTMTDSQGRITGTVTDADGAPIAGATVTATDGKRSWPVTSSSASPR